MNLSDTFYLRLAGDYASPLNTADRLPVVYGDLTDHVNGLWTLPRIDDIAGAPNTPVYCYAAHETLSVANGNTITLYEDGMELNPVMYAFNHANNYAALGTISTIIFTSPKDNAIITARGKGKPTVSGGATLMENIIDIIDDLLTVESDFDSDNYNESAKVYAKNIFDTQGYKAAGVITGHAAYWELLGKMMGGFLGFSYYNSENKLTFTFDINETPSLCHGVIQNPTFIRATIKSVNLINQCPCYYAYNYTATDFRSRTDSSAHANAISQGIYGVRKPSNPFSLYWCRDITTVQTIQDILVAKLKKSIWLIEIRENNTKNARLEKNDIVKTTIKNIYKSDGNFLEDQFFKIIGVNPNYNEQYVDFILEYQPD